MTDPEARLERVIKFMEGLRSEFKEESKRNLSMKVETRRAMYNHLAYLMDSCICVCRDNPIKTNEWMGS